MKLRVGTFIFLFALMTGHVFGEPRVSSGRPEGPEPPPDTEQADSSASPVPCPALVFLGALYPTMPLATTYSSAYLRQMRSYSQTLFFVNAMNNFEVPDPIQPEGPEQLSTPEASDQQFVLQLIGPNATSAPAPALSSINLSSFLPANAQIRKIGESYVIEFINPETGEPRIALIGTESPGKRYEGSFVVNDIFTATNNLSLIRGGGVAFANTSTVSVLSRDRGENTVRLTTGTRTGGVSSPVLQRVTLAPVVGMEADIGRNIQINMTAGPDFRLFHGYGVNNTPVSGVFSLGVRGSF